MDSAAVGVAEWDAVDRAKPWLWCGGVHGGAPKSVPSSQRNVSVHGQRLFHGATFRHTRSGVTVGSRATLAALASTLSSGNLSHSLRCAASRATAPRSASLIGCGTRRRGSSHLVRSRRASDPTTDGHVLPVRAVPAERWQLLLWPERRQPGSHGPMPAVLLFSAAAWGASSVTGSRVATGRVRRRRCRVFRDSRRS